MGKTKKNNSTKSIKKVSKPNFKTKSSNNHLKNAKLAVGQVKQGKLIISLFFNFLFKKLIFFY